MLTFLMLLHGIPNLTYNFKGSYCHSSIEEVHEKTEENM